MATDLSLFLCSVKFLLNDYVTVAADGSEIHLHRTKVNTKAIPITFIFMFATSQYKCDTIFPSEPSESDIAFALALFQCKRTLVVYWPRTRPRPWSCRSRGWFDRVARSGFGSSYTEWLSHRTWALLITRRAGICTAPVIHNTATLSQIICSATA